MLTLQPPSAPLPPPQPPKESFGAKIKADFRKAKDYLRVKASASPFVQKHWDKPAVRVSRKVARAGGNVVGFVAGNIWATSSKVIRHPRTRKFAKKAAPYLPAVAAPILWGKFGEYSSLDIAKALEVIFTGGVACWPLHRFHNIHLDEVHRREIGKLPGNKHQSHFAEPTRQAKSLMKTTIAVGAVAFGISTLSYYGKTNAQDGFVVTGVKLANHIVPPQFAGWAFEGAKSHVVNASTFVWKKADPYLPASVANILPAPAPVTDNSDSTLAVGKAAVPLWTRNLYDDKGNIETVIQPTNDVCVVALSPDGQTAQVKIGSVTGFIQPQFLKPDPAGDSACRPTAAPQKGDKLPKTF